MNREEKRWMERQNERGRRKQKQEEASKIRKLVGEAKEEIEVNVSQRLLRRMIHVSRNTKKKRSKRSF